MTLKSFDAVALGFDTAELFLTRVITGDITSASDLEFLMRKFSPAARALVTQRGAYITALYLVS